MGKGLFEVLFEYWPIFLKGLWGTLKYAFIAVTLGSIVVVKDLDEDCEDKYEIVGSQEANPREGRISDDSPVGKGLIGHRAGETLAIPVPSGEVRLEIISVQNL